MRRRLAAALAAVLTFAAAPAATALEFQFERSNGQDVLVARGPVVTGDANRLASLLQQGRRVDLVVFRSPGGAAQEGMEIGRVLRRAGVATHLPSGFDCASACTYAFLGGRVRTADPGARYGVHMFTVSQNQELMQRLAQEIRRGGADATAEVVRLLEESSAQFAAKLAYYSVEMGVSLRLLEPNFRTRNETVRWLSLNELRDLNVVNAN
jgi:hypothetical protein